MMQPKLSPLKINYQLLLILLGIALLLSFSNTIAGQATISISNPTVTEGNSGTSTVTFSVVCDPCASVNAIINWRINDGTATTADLDYVDKSGKIDDIGNGTAVETVNIAVQVNGDTKVEADETFELELYGASVGAPSLLFKNNYRTGTATIINDDEEEEETNGPSIYIWILILIILLIIFFCIYKRFWWRKS